MRSTMDFVRSELGKADQPKRLNDITLTRLPLSACALLLSLLLGPAVLLQAPQTSGNSVAFS